MGSRSERTSRLGVVIAIFVGGAVLIWICDRGAVLQIWERISGGRTNSIPERWGIQELLNHLEDRGSGSASHTNMSAAGVPGNVYHVDTPRCEFFVAVRSSAKEAAEKPCPLGGVEKFSRGHFAFGCDDHDSARILKRLLP